MAKSRAYSLPGALGNAGKVLNAPDQKLKEGKRLIKKFCIPRNPTKNNTRLRTLLSDDPSDAANFYAYNIMDIKAEAAISSQLPAHDENVWLMDQAINFRGVGVDSESVGNCVAIVKAIHSKYAVELGAMTGGIKPTELAQLKVWLETNGLPMDSLDKDHIEDALERDDLPPQCKRALEIRQAISSGSATKALSISANMPDNTSRLYGLFTYCGSHTGRWTGRGPQPQNLKNSGPNVERCGNGHYFQSGALICPGCQTADISPAKWDIDAVEFALSVIATRDIGRVETYFDDALATVAGCLRGLFCAMPGADLLCSDFTAIEAVVLAALAGEEWRLEVFRTHGMIYEISASKITGIPFEEFIAHKERTGEDHPKRKSIGKVAELASGYQGSVGAWKAFGADKYMNDIEIKENVDKWRADSPNIVKFWYAVQNAAIDATNFPHNIFKVRDISFQKRWDVLYCRLPSGRELAYHHPRVTPHPEWTRREILTYEGWNTNPKNGPRGWIRMPTYGGKLTENITQAVANDIQREAMLRLEAHGYPIVLHVHDEICSEVMEGTGSLEELEQLMCVREPWFADWPIKAAGGWRGKRYRKG
jgi:DNA polymerase